MKYKSLIIIILFFQIINGQNQNFGDLKTIDSKVLNEKREVKILLPPNYTQ